MNRVLLKYYRQAEQQKKGSEERYRLQKIQDGVIHSPKIERDVYKRVGLYNADDYTFYADENVAFYVLKIQSMLLSYQLMNIQYANLLDETLNYYKGISAVPIVAIAPDVFVYEFKAPFDKKFFQTLIDDQCDILEFGDEYVKIHNNVCYATHELLLLFVHQPSEEVKQLRQKLCNQLK